MKRSLTVPALLASFVLLAGCGTATGDAATTEGSTPMSTESASPSIPAGEWVTVSTVTAETVETDPTVKSVTDFMMQAANGSGTATMRVKEEDGRPGYLMEASMDGERFLSILRIDDGTVAYSSGDGEQWCTTEPIPADKELEVTDWSCRSGRPDGGNEFEQVVGYGWLGALPEGFFGGTIYGYEATEALVEQNGSMVRMTFQGLPSGEGVVIYDSAAGTVTIVEEGKEPEVLTFTTNLPAEWPELPAPAVE